MAVLPFDLKGKRVFVAGHRGMVGSAIVRRLGREGAEVLTVSRSELDLLDQAAVNRWFAAMRPQVVFHAAAKVGGIVANVGKQIGGSLGSTIGREIVRGTLGGIMKR